MSAWSGVGAAYDASYASLCAGTNGVLIDALGSAPGRRILDVGSGTGALAQRLRDAAWTVTGLEPEVSMREIAQRRHPDISFDEGALPALPYADAAFDAVTANFVLNHVDDPRRSARELRRVAVPGGLLAATSWSFSPSWFWSAVADLAGLRPRTGRRLPAEKDFERTASGFERMLIEADWHRVGVCEKTWIWRVSAEGLWQSAQGGVASAGAFYLELGAQDKERFRAAFDEVCAEHSVDGVVDLEHTAVIAIGTSG